MSNVLAGIGRGQLKVLDKRIKKKKYIFEYYKRELSSLDGIEFMPVNGWNKPNYWLSCILLNGQVKPIDVMEALEKENINIILLRSFSCGLYKLFYFADSNSFGSLPSLLFF